MIINRNIFFKVFKQNNFSRFSFKTFSYDFHEKILSYDFHIKYFVYEHFSCKYDVSFQYLSYTLFLAENNLMSKSLMGNYRCNFIVTVDCFDL